MPFRNGIGTLNKSQRMEYPNPINARQIHTPFMLTLWAKHAIVDAKESKGNIDAKKMTKQQLKRNSPAAKNLIIAGKNRERERRRWRERWKKVEEKHSGGLRWYSMQWHWSWVGMMHWLSNDDIRTKSLVHYQRSVGECRFREREGEQKKKKFTKNVQALWR